MDKAAGCIWESAVLSVSVSFFFFSNFSLTLALVCVQLSRFTVSSRAYVKNVAYTFPVEASWGYSDANILPIPESLCDILFLLFQCGLSCVAVAHFPLEL